MITFVKIPKKRLKLLEKVKNVLEKKGGKIEIDDCVVIESEDPILGLKLKDAVIAFGRGFSIDECLLLLGEEYVLDVINVKDYAKSKKRIKELKGRVIGRNGKVKMMIEEMTNTKIRIYGKTVSVIGRYEDVRKASEAIRLILSGRKHGTVYRFLERF